MEIRIWSLFLCVAVSVVEEIPLLGHCATQVLLPSGEHVLLPESFVTQPDPTKYNF